MYCLEKEPKPVAQVLRVNPKKAEERNNHDGDHSIKNIISGINSENIVATVD